MAEGRIAVIGEALIDLAEAGDDEPRLARPGGSPYNVALGLARLGRPAAFVGRLSRDPLGHLLREHAARSDVDLSYCVAAQQPTTVALVSLDAHGGARYRFGVDGTADFQWTDAELAHAPDDVAAVHFGSLASWLEPGATPIARRVAALNDRGAAVSYDPNVRPHLQPDRAAARKRVETALGLAHLVKTSVEDVDWLRPGEPVEDVAASWLALGPSAVVITRGRDGATVVTTQSTVHRPAPPVEVVDTVGAGDAFMSGLLDALAERESLTPQGIATAAWPQVLDHAALVAAITCSRAGANPPRRHELGTHR
ncbi:MAG TPA: carbohydrate kinase [Jatrophihabitans sp.]|nr:carbohydrate kinase [Jatrophihabitans sp.]